MRLMVRVLESSDNSEYPVGCSIVMEFCDPLGNTPKGVTGFLRRAMCNLAVDRRKEVVRGV